MRGRYFEAAETKVWSKDLFKTLGLDVLGDDAVADLAELGGANLLLGLRPPRLLLFSQRRFKAIGQSTSVHPQGRNRLEPADEVAV